MISLLVVVVVVVVRVVAQWGEEEQSWCLLYSRHIRLNTQCLNLLDIRHQLGSRFSLDFHS